MLLLLKILLHKTLPLPHSYPTNITSSSPTNPHPNPSFNIDHKLPNPINPDHKLPSIEEKKTKTLVSNITTCNNKNFIKEQYSESISYLEQKDKSNALSGIMCISDKIRTILSENSKEADMLREYLLSIFYKTLYYSFRTDDLRENMKNLMDVFDTMPSKKEKNYILYKFFDDKKEITLIQNFLTVIWAHHSFDYELLKEIAGPYINVESYKNSKISILQIIEVLFMKHNFYTEDNLNKNEEFKDTIAIMVNPENPPENFSTIESMKQCNQAYADFIIIHKTTKEILKFVDIKSYTGNNLNNAHNRISIFPNNNIWFLREFNNIDCTLIVIFKGLKGEQLEIFSDYINEIKLIKNTCSDPYERFHRLRKVLKKLFLDPIFKDLKMDLANSSDKVAITFYHHFELYVKDKIEKEKYNIEYITKLFPKDNCVTPEEKKIVLFYYMKTLFTDDIKEIQENAMKIWKEIGFIEQ